MAGDGTALVVYLLIRAALYLLSISLFRESTRRDFICPERLPHYLLAGATTTYLCYDLRWLPERKGRKSRVQTKVQFNQRAAEWMLKLTRITLRI